MYIRLAFRLTIIFGRFDLRKGLQVFGGVNNLRLCGLSADAELHRFFFLALVLYLHHPRAIHAGAAGQVKDVFLDRGPVATPALVVGQVLDVGRELGLIQILAGLDLRNARHCFLGKMLCRDRDPNGLELRLQPFVNMKHDVCTTVILVEYEFARHLGEAVAVGLVVLFERFHVSIDRRLVMNT